MARAGARQGGVERLLTPDDCFTPEAVYEAVLDGAKHEYGIGPDTRILRPFWPGGDYQQEDYGGDCVVIDNPPCSIISQIVREILYVFTGADVV